MEEEVERKRRKKRRKQRTKKQTKKKKTKTKSRRRRKEEEQGRGGRGRRRSKEERDRERESERENVESHANVGKPAKITDISCNGHLKDKLIRARWRWAHGPEGVTRQPLKRKNRVFIYFGSSKSAQAPATCRQGQKTREMGNNGKP